jgi:hypothetical protein
VGGLLRGRRDIRATGPLREVLSAIPLVDQHAHGILRAHPTSIDEFRGLFSESPDPRQWPHVATGLTYRRAITVLAAHLECEPTELDVFERRLATDAAEYASSLLRATGMERLFVDDGYPPPGTGTSWDELGELAGCEARPIMRIERVVEEDGEEAVAGEVSTARERGFVALKTIAAYRGGLISTLRPRSRAAARGAEANEATGDPLPVQGPLRLRTPISTSRARSRLAEAPTGAVPRHRRSCCSIATRSSARPAGWRTSTATSGSTSR